MSATDLAYGRFVCWRGLRGLIVDIQWHGRSARVQIQVAGGHLHWATPSELEVWYAHHD